MLNIWLRYGIHFSRLAKYKDYFHNFLYCHNFRSYIYLYILHYIHYYIYHIYCYILYMH